MVYPDLFPNRIAPGLAPAGRAITIELFCYLLISLGLSCSRRSSWARFALSAAFATGLLAAGASYDWF